MVMEWNVYMHVIDFSFTKQEVRYGSLLAEIAQNTTAAALDSPHFSKKAWWLRFLEGSYYLNPRRQMRILFQGEIILFEMS